MLWFGLGFQALEPCFVSIPEEDGLLCCAAASVQQHQAVPAEPSRGDTCA